MRYLSTFAAIVLTALLVCAASAGYADASPPSTDGWFLAPVVDGDNIHLYLGIDNMDDLANWQGLVSRTWGDPTGTDPTQYLDLGNGAALQSMTVKVDGDPQVSVEFHVVAGSTDTNFIITSDIVTFSTLSNCKGTATAALTVTDRNGNGAVASGGFANGSFFRGICNSASDDTFCYLIDHAINASGYSSNTASAGVPPWQLMTNISDISAEFRFRLSAHDSASGTSNFVVLPVPEPGAMVALLSGLTGLAGFALRRRRA